MFSLSTRIFFAFGFIGLNACFVVAEYALIKVRASRLEILARHGNQRAVLVQNMLNNLDVYLSAVQFGITMASLGLGWIGEPAVGRVLEQYLQRVPIPYGDIVTHGLAFVVAFGIIIATHIVLGELVPRSIGIQKSEVIALWTALPLRVFYLAFKTPITWIANSSIWILRLLRFKPASEADTQLSEEEIRIILGASEERAGFSLERLMLMENIFDFGNAKVSDALVPKDKVAVLSTSRSFKDNIEVIRSRHFSRYPLCRTDDLGSAFGFIHVNDVLANYPVAGVPPAGGASPGEADLAALRRDLRVVGPDDSLQKLLQVFTGQGVHMALVRDRESAAVGIISLEDILEELVGEIRNEYDLPQAWSLMDVVIPAAVEVGMECARREECIERLIHKLKASYPPLDLAEALKTTIGREEKFSSGVGHGVALPHGRLSKLDRPLVGIGRALKPFPFQAPDKIPVRLVFLILTPAGTPVIQLKILGRIASLISNDNLRRRLLRAKTSEQLLTILRTADNVLPV